MPMDFNALLKLHEQLDQACFSADKQRFSAQSILIFNLIGILYFCSPETLRE
jgi:hypothetical protein